MVERQQPATSQKPPWLELALALRWPVAMVLVALLGVTLVYKMYRATTQGAERAVEAVGDMAGRAVEGATELAGTFFTGDVTESFIAAIPEISSTEFGNLELATAVVTETFRRTEERRALWERFYLGTTILEIQVPVTYRYHLRLAEEWKITVDGPVCTVVAPAIRPNLPPAIHTDQMEKRVDDGWLLFDGDVKLDELERTVTPRLVEYAQDEKHLNFVRDEARRTVERFVRGWLLREGQWGEDQIRVIQVRFEGEEMTDLGLEQQLEPLELEPRKRRDQPQP